MRTSTERILTTHTGSLPRPAGLVDRCDKEVPGAVAETVRRQRKAGVDVINDGEVSKPSYVTYVTERLTGFEGDAAPVTRWRGRGADDFPEFFERQWSEARRRGDHDEADLQRPRYLPGRCSMVEADIST